MASSLDTTEGPLLKRSLMLAGPAVLQAILVNFYAFNDYYFIGLTGNQAATAALSACFALVIVSNTLIGVVPMGALTLMAQSFGKKRPDQVASLARTAFGSGLIWAVLLGGLLLGGMPQIVGLVNVTEAVGRELSEYFGTLCFGLGMFALMRIVVSTFYACGDTTTPLKLEVASLLLNTLLNYTLVLGHFGMPAMGMQGAAIATIASRALPGLAGGYLIARGGLGLNLWTNPADPAGRASWLPVTLDLRHMIRIGIFESVSGMLYGTIYLVLNRIAGQIGPAAQGGLGAGLRGIEWIAFALADGFLTANIAVVGQNIGAGKLRRALRGAWLNAGLSALTTQLVALSFLLIPETLCRLITEDPETLMYAVRYTKIMGWFMWAVGLDMAFYGAMIGAGWTAWALCITGLNNVLRIPLAAVLIFGHDRLVQGVLWAFFGTGSAPPMLPPATQSFDALTWAIAITALTKAILFVGFFLKKSRDLPQTEEATG